MLLDLARDLVREEHGIVVADLLRLDDHPDLAARLEGVDAVDPLPLARQLLERLEALDVGLEALAARSGPRGRDRVGRDHEHRLDRLRLHLVMVRLDRVHDPVGLAVALRVAGGDERVRALLLVGQSLAEVVQKARRAWPS